MDLKQFLDAVSTLGALGFAILAVYALVTERVVPRGRLDDQKADKKEAMDLAQQSVAAMDRLADAVEARNRLEEARERAEAEVRRGAR